MRLTLKDDDAGTLRAMDGARVVQAWPYTDATLRATYRAARQFCEGWHAAHVAQLPVAEAV